MTFKQYKEYLLEQIDKDNGYTKRDKKALQDILTGKRQRIHNDTIHNYCTSFAAKFLLTGDISYETYENIYEWLDKKL